MPTQPAAPSITRLDPQAAFDKLAGLITELPAPSDVTAQPSDPAAPAPTPPPSEAPAADPASPAPDAHPADEPLFDVKVDGETLSVDLAELKHGYSRGEDYNRKTRKLADERRAFETERQTLTADADRYRQGLTQLTAALKRLHGDEPDWAELHRTLPPDEFLKRKADWEASRAQLDRLQRHEQDEAQAAQVQQAAEFQRYRRGEQDKLLAAIPEWADATKRDAEQLQMLAAAKHYGYTEADVRAVSDHRALLLLRDAMRYRELQREPSPPVKPASTIRTAKPGKPATPRPDAAHQQLLTKVQQTGRQRDAMAAIADLLPD